jgi:hypothetical protein
MDLSAGVTDDSGGEDWANTPPWKRKGPAPEKTEIHPTTWGDVWHGLPHFIGQVDRAATKDYHDLAEGFAGGVQKTGDTLRDDPSAIVPLWFGGMMKALGAGGQTISTPVSLAFKGEGWDAMSAAAGGDPEAAHRYAEQGNAGGEFWEMAGKPLAMLGLGMGIGESGLPGFKALAPRVAEDAQYSRLQVVRGLMLDGSQARMPVDIADAQLAQQGLQDAARELGLADRKVLKDFTQGTGQWGVEQGNKNVFNMVEKAVEIADRPADLINATYGYLPGEDVVHAIHTDLYRQAWEAEKRGNTKYARQLYARADDLQYARTLNEIYNVKKEANKLAGVERTTADSINLMDSYAAQAKAIRDNLYPVYEKYINRLPNGAPGPLARDQIFSLRQAGRKEGATISMRNGVEKRLYAAQKSTADLHIPGGKMKYPEQTASVKRGILEGGIDTARQHGILPSPQGNVNRAVRKAVGRLSPETRPESLTVTESAKFGPAPPTTKALPGRTMQFEIPGNLPTFTREGKIAHTAAKAPRHAYESPAYMTSSGPEPVSGGVGTTGPDISTAKPAEAQSDVAVGPGTMLTRDPAVARSARNSMENLIRSKKFSTLNVAQQKRVVDAYTKLSHQLDLFDENLRAGSAASHTPAEMQYTPRKTGTVPASHTRRAINTLRRKGIPTMASSFERGLNEGKSPTDAYSQNQ